MPHIWLIAADWLEEQGLDVTASAFREGIWNIIQDGKGDFYICRGIHLSNKDEKYYGPRKREKYNLICSGSGDGCGDGHGNGEGFGYADGKGHYSNNQGFGDGDSDGHGDGEGNNTFIFGPK